MRAVDEAIRQFGLANVIGQKFILVQLGTMPLDFELAEVAEFLEMASLHDDLGVRAQAGRSLRRVLPLLEKRQLGRSRGAATDEAGTWSSYGLGSKSFTDTLMKLVDAGEQDFSDVDLDMLHSSAMHKLEPCINAVVCLAKEGPHDVRLSAIRALGQLNAPQSLETLTGLLADEDFVVQAAISLAEIGTKDALTALLAVMNNHRDKPYFAQLVAELGAFNDTEAVFSIVKEMSGATDDVRLNGTIALGMSEGDEAKEALLALVDDENEEVRAFAIEALGRRRITESLSSVRDAFFNSALPLVREAAVAALGRFGDDSAREVLSSGLEDKAMRVRARSIESLVRLRVPDSDLFQYVVPLVQDPEEMVSANAILALAPVDSSLALQKIFSFLKARHEYGRAQGVYCLSYVRNSTTGDLLTRIINSDVSEVVTRQATKALAKYPKDEAVPRLLPLLNHQHVGVRKTAARVLGKVGESGDVSIFEKLVGRFGRERSAEVKVAIIESLATVGQSNQHLTVAALGEKQPPEVTATVLQALDLLGNISSIDEFEKHLDEKDGRVKGRAAVALWHLGHMKLLDKLLIDLQTDEQDVVCASLQACHSLGLSLRHLPDLGSYPLVLNELKNNAETQAFQDSGFAHQRSNLFLPEEEEVEEESPAETLNELVDVDELERLTDGFGEFITSLDDDDTPACGASLVGLAEPDEIPQGPHAYDGTIINVLRLLVDGKAEEALETTSKVVEKCDEPSARFLLGKILLSLKKFEEGEKHLAILADKCDDFVNPLLTLVGLCQRRANRRQGVAYFAAAMGAFHDCLREQIITMDKHLTSNQLKALPAFVRELQQQLPFMDKMHARFGRFLLDLGRPGAAFEQLLLGHLADPAAGDIILDLARSAARSGRYTYARHLLYKTLLVPTAKGQEATAELVVAKRAALMCLAETPHDDDCLEMIKRVFRKEDNAEVKALAREFIHTWRQEEVEEDLDKPDDSIEIQLENIVNHLKTGLAHEAVSEAEQLAGSSRAVEARFIQARALLAQDRGPDAGALLQRIIVDADNFINPVLLLVGLCQKHKDHKGMFSYFAKAARMSMDLLEEQFSALDRLLMDGDLDSYAWFMGDVSSHLPTIGTTHRRTGMLSLISNDFERAYHHLLFAHLCNPADVEVCRGLAHAGLEIEQYDVVRLLCNNLIEKCDRENVRRDAEACLARLPQD